MIQQATVPTTEVDVEASVRRSSAGADVTDSDAVDLTAATRRLSPVTGDASVDAAADGVTDGLPQTSAAAAAALSEEYRRRYVKYERLCELITLKVENLSLSVRFQRSVLVCGKCLCNGTVSVCPVSDCLSALSIDSCGGVLLVCRSTGRYRSIVASASARARTAASVNAVTRGTRFDTDLLVHCLLCVIFVRRFGISFSRVAHIAKAAYWILCVVVLLGDNVLLTLTA